MKRLRERSHIHTEATAIPRRKADRNVGSLAAQHSSCRSDDRGAIGVLMIRLQSATNIAQQPQQGNGLGRRDRSAVLLCRVHVVAIRVAGWKCGEKAEGGTRLAP